MSSLLKERTSLKYIEEYLLFRFDESLHDIGCPTGESCPFSCSIEQLKTVQAQFDVTVKHSVMFIRPKQSQATSVTPQGILRE